MADIQYLNYGDQQIEQQALMNNLANNVQQYVQNQSWSKKRKEKFMSAYSDLINKGILGASNNTGQWMLDINDDIDFDSMDRKDKEMYGEAAYFIQQQMAGLPTKSSKEEEKNESELPKYDSFSKNFINYVSQNYYGGNPIRTQEDWNVLDERNAETGLRETDNRVKRLSDYLKNYSDSLEEGKYNFEGSPFKNLTDLKTKINTAITKLNDGTWNQDDTDALNAIGLRSSDWFNNGSEDPYKTEGYEGTYGDYYQNYLPKLEKAKQEAEVAKQKAAKQAAYNNTLFITRGSAKLQGKSPQQLKQKYGADDKLRQALFQYSQSDIRNLSPDEQSEIHGAYRYLAKSPIDTNLFNKLKQSSGGLYKNANPNRFKKIDGIDGLIWDSAAGQVIQIQNREQYNANNQSQDLFSGVKTQQDMQDDYMNSTEGGFTPAEQREVAALLFDLGAAVDPEGFSSAGLSQLAAGIRDYNRASDPKGWTWGDTGWAALDHGLGLLSLIPVAGGWIKGGQAASRLAKYLPKMEQYIRLAGRAGATYAMGTNASGALNTLNKIKNGEDLSLKDYQDLAYFFIGGLGHHQLNRSNLTARTAMKARGLETSNTLGNKLGFTRTKIQRENSTPTVRMNVEGKGEIEIPITPELKAKLDKKAGKKGNNAEERSKLIREDAEVQKAAEEAGIKVKEKVTDADGKVTEKVSDSWNKATVTYDPSWRNFTVKGVGLPKWMRSESSFFGEKVGNVDLNWNTKEQFESNLAKRNWWDKFIGGSNRDIRRYDRNYLGNIYSAEYKSRFEPEGKVEEVETYNPISRGEATNTPIDKSTSHKYDRAVMKRYREVMEGKFSNKDIETVTEGINIGNEKVTVLNLTDVSGNPLYAIRTSKEIVRFKSLEEAKKYIANIVKEQNKNIIKNPSTGKVNTKEMGRVLQELKKKGWLKQGGTIDKQKIQRYKEFIKK